MIDQFFNDLAVPNCVVQTCTYNKTLAVSTGNADDIKKHLEEHKGKDLFFLGGVDPKKQWERAGDADVLLKNYVYFDWDIRKDNPDMSDSDIKELGASIGGILEKDSMKNWRYVVFTGNGLHIYYFAKTPISIRSRTRWKLGVIKLSQRLNDVLGAKLDPACVNVARIGRLPGSYNMKAQPKLVEIVAFQDNFCDLGIVETLGGREETNIMNENIKRMEEMKKTYPMKNGTYEAIDAIPVHEVMVKLTGWEYVKKNFFSAGDSKPKACFVSDQANRLIHGGTDHIEGSAIGYGPFELAKTMLKLDNGKTFQWFKDTYPHIREVSLKEKMEPAAFIVSAPSLVGLSETDSLFDELEGTHFEQLLLGEKYWAFDNQRFLIRGAVTRIGAYSNVGKSKMAYFLAHRLLKQGNRGIIFSTEVTRSIVLANMIIVETGAHFWDIVEHRYTPPKEVREALKNLSIYDVNHTLNQLVRFEEFIKKHVEEGRKPDFVVIDFVQGVTPSVRTQSEYDQMSRYALEVQSLAQRYNISVLDVSQINNAGLRDEFASAGFIPFKGSGHLYSSADIGILLKRDKKANDGMMQFDIRKHKYLPPRCLDVTCDFRRGTFGVFGQEFDAPIIGRAFGDDGGGEH